MKYWMKGAALVLVLSAGTVFAKNPAPAKPAADCNGDFGTAVVFEDTPADAAKIAKKEGKLVFVLHVSGHFEDPRFT